MTKSLVSELLKSQSFTRNNCFHRYLSYQFFKSLAISADLEIVTNVQTPSCLAIDSIENHHLLVGTTVGTIIAVNLLKSTNGIVLPQERRKKHDNSISSIQWYPLDSGAFASSGRDGLVIIWDFAQMEDAFDFSLRWPINCMKISHNGKLIAAGLTNSEIKLVDVNSGDCCHVFQEHSQSVLSVSWSAGTDYHLVSGSADGRAILWDIRSSGKRAILHQFDSTSTSTSTSRLTHESGVTATRFNKSGDYLVTGGNDRKLKVWNVHTGMLSFEFTDFLPVSRGALELEVVPMMGSSDELVISPSVVNEGDIVGTDLYHGKGMPLVSLSGHFGKITGLAYRPQFQQLISCGNDGLIQLWEPQFPSKLRGNTTYSKEAMGVELVEQDDWSDPLSDSSTFFPPTIASYLNALVKEERDVATETTRRKLQRILPLIEEETNIAKVDNNSTSIIRSRTDPPAESSIALSRRQRTFINTSASAEMAVVSNLDNGNRNVRARIAEDDSAAIGLSISASDEVQTNNSSDPEQALPKISNLKKSSSVNSSSRKKPLSVRAMFAQGKLGKKK